MKFYLFLLLSIFTTSAFCQSSILLISGEEFENASFDSVSGNYLYFTNHKNKSCKVKAEDVYSYTKQGIPTVLYQQNFENGNELTVDEMAEFVKGEKDAMQHYRSKAALGGSVVVGAASGALGFWGVPFPVLYSLACNTSDPKQSKTDMAEKSSVYKAGYSTAAKSKKMRRTLIGGFASFIGTAILISIF